MILYAEALRKILESAGSNALMTETVALENATGRVLSEDVYSSEDLPSFDNSAMDGFCVLSDKTMSAHSENVIWFKSQGMIAAGDVEKIPTALNHEKVCIEIMTGAPLPESGYDAVVRIEDVLVEREANGLAKRVGISRPMMKGDNVRLHGTDILKDSKILLAGTLIESHHLLSCAALGISELRVKKKPRVAVISTGSELVPVGTKLLPHGMIRNSTGVYLEALLKQLGVTCNSFGIFRDDPSEYRKLLLQLQEECYDVVISTGAVSMGQFDFVRDVLEAVGAEVLLHKVSIRPGKPILFAELKARNRKMAFFGMPGNPVSTMVGCRFFLLPYLQRINGLPIETPYWGVLSTTVKKPTGLRCFYKAKVNFADRGFQIESLKTQASYVVGSLSSANCWVVFPEEPKEMNEGELVEFYPFSPPFNGGIT